MERSSASKLPEELVDENDYSKKPNFSLDENNLPVNWSLQIEVFKRTECSWIKSKVEGAEFPIIYIEWQIKHW